MKLQMARGMMREDVQDGQSGSSAFCAFYAVQA